MHNRNSGDTIAISKQAHGLTYATPQLTSYGTVSDLTAAGSGAVSELKPLGPCTGVKQQARC